MTAALKSSKPERASLRLRRATSFLVAFAFVVLLLSGIALFVAPSGRVARDIGWGLIGLNKESWGSLHVVFAVLFVGFGIVHLVLNWRPFRSYLTDRVSHHLRLTRELALSLLIVLLLVLATLFSWPPATQLEAAMSYFRRDFWSSGAVGGNPAHGRRESDSGPVRVRAWPRQLGRTSTDIMPAAAHGHRPAYVSSCCALS